MGLSRVERKNTMKATYQNIKDLITLGKNDPVISKLVKNEKQLAIYQTGYFTPSSANWSWIIGLIDINGQGYEILTRFSVVEGGRLVYIPKYNHNVTKLEAN